MPPATRATGVSSALAQRLGERGRQAHEAHKADETDFGMVSLPGGIVGGVAELDYVKFGQYKEGDNKGKDFLLMMGTVLHPAVHGGVKILGKKTKVGPLPLCDTGGTKPKSLDENLARMLNEWRKLGVDTSKVTIDAYESTAAALEGAGITFQFSTRTSKATPEYPNERVWESWEGTVEFDASTVGDGVADASPAAPANGKVAVSAPKAPAPTAAPKAPVTAPAKPTTSAPKAGPKKPAPAPEPEPEPALADDQQDLDSLVELASSEDESATRDAAQARLTEMAAAAGATQEAIDGAADWSAVRDLIEAGGEGDAGEAAAEEWTPKKGEVYLYKADPKKKAAECEVTSVNAAKQLVGLRNVDTHVEYKAVAWDKLEGAS